MTGGIVQTGGYLYASVSRILCWLYNTLKMDTLPIRPTVLQEQTLSQVLKKRNLYFTTSVQSLYTYTPTHYCTKPRPKRCPYYHNNCIRTLSVASVKPRGTALLFIFLFVFIDNIKDGQNQKGSSDGGGGIRMGRLGGAGHSSSFSSSAKAGVSKSAGGSGGGYGDADVAKLKEAIQTLCQSTHPLGEKDKDATWVGSVVCARVRLGNSMEGTALLTTWLKYGGGVRFYAASGG